MVRVRLAPLLGKTISISFLPVTRSGLSFKTLEVLCMVLGTGSNADIPGNDVDHVLVTTPP